MFVKRTQPPPPASVNLFLQHGAKPCKVSIALFVDYSSTIRGLFVLFVDYSRTIRTIRRLFADYSHYSSTIRGLFVLFVDYSHYSHYSLHYSSFINCQESRAIFKNLSVGGGGHVQTGTILYRVWRNDRWIVGNKKFGVVSHLIVGGGGGGLGVFSPRKVLYFSSPMTAIPCII